MPPAASRPPDEIARLDAPLLARLQTLEGAWAAAQQEWRAEQQRLRLRIQDLEQQLRARAGGRDAGAPDAGLLSLFGDPGALVAPVAAPPTRPARATTPRTQTPGPQPLHPALPREVIVLPDPPAAQRVYATTGAPLVPGFPEVLEVLARRPPVYFVKRYERTVWVSPAKSAPVATPWPADVLPRARMHASVIAHIAAAHFCEHVPYYRLEQQLARTGVALARSTQVSLMTQLDALVAPLVDHLKARVLGSGYVHLDATPVDVCDPARPGRVRSAHLWAYRARSPDPVVEGLVWFDYQATKSPDPPRAVLQGARYRGVVQTDGAAGLDTLGPPEQITHLGCWAHARRYVAEAVALGDPRAPAYLAQVDRLFRTDARARRLVLPPKSALAVALGYLLGQRASLTRCVTTPDAYLDNNAAENAIRPLKVGAKNWLFVGHPDAGPRLANLFTLVENCRQAEIDIEAYLLALLTRLPAHSVRRLGDWLPRAWQRARADGIRP